MACFRNVAAHLEPGGCFVIEVMVPELRRLPPGQDVAVAARAQALTDKADFWGRWAPWQANERSGAW